MQAISLKKCILPTDVGKMPIGQKKQKIAYLCNV